MGEEGGEVSLDTSTGIMNLTTIPVTDAPCASEESSLAIQDVASPKKPFPIQKPAAQQLQTLVVNGGKREEVLAVLITLFGKDMLDKALHVRTINDMQQESLSQKDVLRILGEISSSVTISDLEQWFTEKKVGDHHREILNFLPGFVWTWKWLGSVKELPERDILSMLEMFRNPLQCIDPSYPYHLAEELKREGLNTQCSCIYSTYNFDIEQLYKNGDRSFPAFYLAHQETLARQVAYADPRTTPKGTIIQVFHNEQLHLYKLHDRVDHKGVSCSIFTPLFSNKDLPIQILFQGTCDGNSLKRNLDSSGVGKSTFDECSPQIQEIIKTLTQGGKKSIKVSITGHSLGGCDAQRCCIDIANLAHKEKCIKEINLYAYSSPRLDLKTITKWHETLSKLSLNEQKPHLTLSFAFHEKDLVAWSGGNDYLSGTDECFIPITYLIVQSNSGWTNISNHTVPFFHHGNFDCTTENRTCQLYQSVSTTELTSFKNKLCELEHTSILFSLYLYLKSFFSSNSTPEQLKKEITRLEEQQKRWEKMQETHPKYIKIWITATQFFCYLVSLLTDTKFEPYTKMEIQEQQTKVAAPSA